MRLREPQATGQHPQGSRMLQHIVKNGISVIDYQIV
jgi:hypothetical protein